jgi:hypothetical protein
VPGKIYGRGYPAPPRFNGKSYFIRPAGEVYTTPLPSQLATATGRPGSGHLFYASDTAAWWLLWVNAGDDTLLRSAWSTDLLTWTAAETTYLALGLGGGYSLAAAYRSIASTDVVHIGYGVRVSATLHRTYHLRATITAGSITFGASAEIATAATGTDAGTVYTDAIAVGYDSTNKVYRQSSYIDAASNTGNPNTAISTNADAGTSWTPGFGASTQYEQVAQLCWSAANFDLGSGAVLALWDNGANTTTHTDLRWSKWTGSWSAAANVFGSSSTQDANDWGAAERTNTDVHVVRRLTSTTYEHRRFNGTAWSAGQAIPSQANKTGAGLFMASDGVDVWLLVVASDAANSVQYVKWSSGSSTWGSWAVHEASTQVRTALSGSETVAASTIAVCWTETTPDGTFQIVTKPLVTATIHDAAGVAASTTTGSGSLTVATPVAGTAASTTTATGELTRVTPVAGAAATTTAATGALSLIVIHAIAGTAATTTSATAALTRVTPLAGTAASTTTATATITATGALSGAAASTTTAAASLTRTTPVAGTAATVTSATGALTVVTVHPIAGAATSTTSASAALTLVTPVSGVAATTTSATATITATSTLAGTAATTTSAAADLTRITTLSAAAASITSAAAALTITSGPLTYAIAGTAASTTTATAAITATGALTGAAASTTSATAALTGRLAFAGSAASATSATGAVIQLAALNGAASSTTTATGSIGIRYTIAGAGATLTTATGDLAIGSATTTWPIAGIATTITSSTGRLTTRTHRPITSTTPRPGTGDTIRPVTSSTLRPGSGATLRPVTTVTERP